MRTDQSTPIPVTLPVPVLVPSRSSLLRDGVLLLNLILPLLMSNPLLWWGLTTRTRCHYVRRTGLLRGACAHTSRLKAPVHHLRPSMPRWPCLQLVNADSTIPVTVSVDPKFSTATKAEHGGSNPPQNHSAGQTSVSSRMSTPRLYARPPFHQHTGYPADPMRRCLCSVRTPPHITRPSEPSRLPPMNLSPRNYEDSLQEMHIYTRQLQSNDC